MSSSELAPGARLRLPREPYPGLRPFMDFEAALLFGRERQCQEVIARLAQQQFVAVLGGSGSGKSSLVHASVIPELRSFGIPGAGDLWLPLTCTPGTNAQEPGDAAQRSSPVTRLARRFAGLLRSRGSIEADAQRVATIAEVVRQEAGLARLLDAYSAELLVPPGPDPKDARVLFVLDQFEEVFHPSNVGVEDARLLVERVIDHFFNPHPNCHVVLTMRSEYLNACATFLELPDAINKSSYLVRRMNADELREVITGPAQRFLRLAARSQDAGSLLPDTVAFEPAVVERILRDTLAIAHDPDHLPLLQHLLARLWEAALAREELDTPVPSHITQVDLVRAVTAGVGASRGEEQPLEDRVNTLRACVENWPEAIYRWHDLPKRAQLDAILRRLGYWDPNTGQYTQQRLDVDSAAQGLGAGETRTDLRALLADGFLGGVDYLFWDDEDPARVTVKVSHESFIRGWAHLRRLIDVEAERFDEYLGVLRQCAAWAASGRSDDFLLEAGEMRRLHETGFEERLRQPGQREAWGRLLEGDRDSLRLASQQHELDAYLGRAGQRLRERERKAGNSRRSWLLVAVLTLLAAPSALYSVLLQGPVSERAALLFDAGNRANQAELAPDYAGVGAATQVLDSLLRAAELVDDARTGKGSVMTVVSQVILDRLDWIPFVRSQGRFLGDVAAQTEPAVNGKLRQLLSTAVWVGLPSQAAEDAFIEPLSLTMNCEPRPGASSGVSQVRPGRLFVARSEAASQRALFVPPWKDGADDAAIVIRSASYNPASDRCEYGPVVLSVPLELDPRLIVDASLRHIVYSLAGPQVEVPSVTVQELDWARSEAQNGRPLQSQVRAVISSPTAVEQVKAAAGEDRIRAVDTWRSEGGRSFTVNAKAWRLFSPSALRLKAGMAEADFVPLQPSAGDSPCGRLARGLKVQAGFRHQVLEDAGHCFVVQRGNADADAPDRAIPAVPIDAVQEQVMAAVYERPPREVQAGRADSVPTPIASLAQFGYVKSAEGSWLVGVRGDHAGWLALQSPVAQGPQRLLGAPWSTCALWRLGRQLSPAGTTSAPSDRCSGR